MLLETLPTQHDINQTLPYDLPLAEWPEHELGSMLEQLTGLEASDDGSRQLLSDIFRYQSWLEFSSDSKWPLRLAARRWMKEVYTPAMSQLDQGFYPVTYIQA